MKIVLFTIKLLLQIVTFFSVQALIMAAMWAQQDQRDPKYVVAGKTTNARAGIIPVTLTLWDRAILIRCAVGTGGEVDFTSLL